MKKSSQNSIHLSIQKSCLAVLLVLMILVVLFANILFWNIPRLGLEIDPISHRVVYIDPNGYTFNTGIRINDVVNSIYGYPLEYLNKSISILPYIDTTKKVAPIEITRDGLLYTYSISFDNPDVTFQVQKATYILLSCICFITAYMLGFIRKFEFIPLSLPLLWIGIASFSGLFFVAQYTSYYFTILLYGILITTFIPLSVYIHHFFPVEFPSKELELRKKKKYGLIVGILNIIFVVLIFSPLSPIFIIHITSIALLIFTPIALFGGMYILHQRYKSSLIAHNKRQIRIICLSYIIVGSVWLVCVVASHFFIQRSLIPPFIVDLFLIIIPISYLVVSMLDDLYNIDTFLSYWMTHFITITSITLMLIIISMFSNTPLLLSFIITFSLLYQPIRNTFIRIQKYKERNKHTYMFIHTTIQQLTTTLDKNILIDRLCSGIKETFHSPIICYIQEIETNYKLAYHNTHYQLPTEIITSESFIKVIRMNHIISSSSLYHNLQDEELSLDERNLLYTPNIMLWLGLKNTDGSLIGFILLGRRYDFEPYRQKDIYELQDLLNAASLALTNSSTYHKQLDAEQNIRQLYHKLQEVQDTTAAAIAREIHDEVINVTLRLNIKAILSLIESTADQTLKYKLTEILEGDKTTINILRWICEELHPVGITDPLGLPTLLRSHVERVNMYWEGQCLLSILNNPCAISIRSQYEVLRITREAVTNAIKHANATIITIFLIYPHQQQQHLCIEIQDNGIGTSHTKPKSGHFGLRNMAESASSIKGSLEIISRIHRGTTIKCLFPPTVDNEEETPNESIYQAINGSALS